MGKGAFAVFVTLLDAERVRTVVLPQKAGGRYRLADQLFAEGAGGSWQLRAGRKYQRPSFVLEEGNAYLLAERETGRQIVLLTERETIGRKTFRRFLLPQGGSVSIGRGDGCDIQYAAPFVSQPHARLEERGGSLLLTDAGSKNGVYVNGRRVSSAELRPGDTVYICGLRLLAGRGFVALNNPDGMVRCGDRLRLMEAQHVPELAEEEEAAPEQPLFGRSPRFRREIEPARFSADAPPASPDQGGTPVMLMLGPSITMGMASLGTGIFSVYNALNNGGWLSAAPSLIMSASMLMGTMLWPVLTKVLDRRRRRKKEAERVDKYRRYLDVLRLRIAEEGQRQAEILRENTATLDDCLDRIRNRRRSLWERMESHSDFLTMRLGVGELPMQAEFRFPESRFTVEEDPLQAELEAFCREPRNIPDVPITLPLKEACISGVVGPKERLLPFLKGLVLQLAALHGYDEVKLAFFLSEEEEADWDFARWLPHTWDAEKTAHFFAAGEDTRKALAGHLEKIFQARGEEEGRREKIRTWYVLVVPDPAVLPRLEIARRILEAPECRGFVLLCAAGELRLLPRECRLVADLTAAEGRLFQPESIDGEGTAFQPDISFEGSGRELAVSLANTALDTGSGRKRLPDMVPFLKMFGVGKIEHLNALDRWKEHDPTKTLETPVGVGEDGELFMLDLHQDYHGPHGLVAGMTGSGKSEFIITYILSMAVNYHPDEVAFILIDYKGGGMAKAFERLPHTVGIITNLDGSGIERSLLSIESELARRERIFQETSRQIGASNIDIYRYQKLYRSGSVREPLPHLFIISDEFAELRAQKREFMDKLISTARIGRSLGVHLILATQKPNGVVDEQIWSNSRFKVCLKVQDKRDSADMIRRPDAADLSQTGRFYLLVGYNEFFAQGQSAWSGAAYIPADRPESGRDRKVSLLDSVGRVLRQGEIKRKTVGDPMKQLDGIVDYLAGLAAQEGIKSRPMWMPPLPSKLDWEKLLEKYVTAPGGKPAVGEMDDPARQRQALLRADETENMVVYGAAGSGKTTFVTTLLYALLSSRTPDQFQAYLVDFGAETLRMFAKAPHIGDVVLNGEDEKLQNLFRMLKEELARRRRLCSEWGGDAASYRKASGKPMPQLLVVIHNYAGFSESCEALEPQVGVMAREGVKYGVTFLLTAANAGAVRFRTLQNFRQFYVLRMNDRSEYTSVLGGACSILPSEVKGRGLCREGQEALEFQTAWLGEDPGPRVQNFCRELSAEWKGRRAARVPILPERVTASFVEDAVEPETLSFPLGIAKQSLEPCMLRITARPIHFILSRGGDSGFLGAFAALLEGKLGDGFRALDGDGRLDGCCARLSAGEDGLNQTVTEIFGELVRRHNEAKALREAGNPAPVYPPKVYLVSGLSQVLSKLDPDRQDKLHQLLERCTVPLAVFFIMADRADALSSYAIKPWFKHLSPLENGVWLGDGAAEQYQLKLHSDRSLYAKIGENFGYLAKDGAPVLMKLLEREENDG